LVRRTGEQKEKLVKETLKALEDLVEFKSHITRSLQDLEKGVVDDLNEERNALGNESAIAQVSAGQRMSVSMEDVQAMDCNTENILNQMN
jgi:hypothetical protein